MTDLPLAEYERRTRQRAALGMIAYHAEPVAYHAESMLPYLLVLDHREPFRTQAEATLEEAEKNLEAALRAVREAKKHYAGLKAA